MFQGMFRKRGRHLTLRYNWWIWQSSHEESNQIPVHQLRDAAETATIASC